MGDLFLRNSVLSLTAFLFACAFSSARAEEVASAPGWSLNKIQEQKAENDFSYGDSRVYFSLKPPDQRPAITIDGRSADRLRSGEASAEGLYSGQSAKSQQSKDDEYVYGNKGNGLVVAEPVMSTLTAADGRRDSAYDAPAVAESRGSSSSESSLGGLSGGSSSSSSSSSYGAPSSSPPSRNTSASSAPPPAAGPPPAGGGDRAIVDPRKVAMEQAKPLEPVKPATTTGIAATNEAGGFAIKKKDKNGKEINEKDKDFIVWPGGEEPGKDGTKPKCARSVFKNFDQPGMDRLRIPEGCGTIAVRAWGGGGGSGGVSEDGSETKGIGGGGAFVYTTGLVDVKKFDVIVVVGGAGGHAKGSSGGAPGFISGGKGGTNGGAGAFGAGGGGGYSGVFLVERGKGDEKEMPIEVENAIVIAAGGGGGSASGEAGGPGGITRGGGNGASQSGGGIGSGNGKGGVSLMGGDGGDGAGVNACGGGGGGGLFGGGGGGASTTLDGASAGGGGGSSFYRFLDNFETGSGSGAQAGNKNYKDRGKAGDAGMPGKVILEFY